MNIGDSPRDEYLRPNISKTLFEPVNFSVFL